MFRSIIVLVLALAATTAFAQIGDRLDRPGDVQKSLVPREQIPPAPALSPEEALKTFTLAPGIKLELAAAEPLVQDPVAMTFGPDGRMWVVEMRGYMNDLDGSAEDAPVGRIVVLRDRDGDGRFDDSTVFVDQLVLPRTVALVGDGVLVGAPPELAFYRDTNGDGKADKKEILATDYGVRVDPKRPHLANPERAPNGLLWAFDNWIYSAAYTKKFRYVRGEWQTGATIFRGQWGLSQDDWGHLFHDSNSDYLRVDVIFSDYLQRNPNYARLTGTNVNVAENQFVWPARVTPGINRGYRPEMLREGRLKEFTAACAPWVYRGDLLPGFYGNVFVAEPAAHFVRRAVLTAEAGTLRGRNPHAEQQREFIASTDERFRPVNFATGPDGALYIVDLYRGVLQHRISLTTYLRQQSEERKLTAPQHLGRIYRVVPADKPARKAGGIAALTHAQWVEKLGDANAWWRETAQQLLVERNDPATLAPIRHLALKGASPPGRVHALWTLEGMDALDREIVGAALADREAVVRAAAIRLSERFFSAGNGATLVNAVRELTRDPSPEVQLQAVLSLGEVRQPAMDRAMAEVARANPSNTFLRDAFFSGLRDRELLLLESLLGDTAWPADDEANRIVSGLVRGVAGARQLPAIERVIALAALEKNPRRALALLDGLVPATGMSRRPFQLARQPEGWAGLEKSPLLKARLARLNDVVVWPGKPGVSATAVAVPLNDAQRARFEAGRTLFSNICSACHQADGRGLDGLAPPLLDSEWVLGPPERTTRIVLHGLRGPITVAGRVHTGDMPALGGALDDEQIASVLTYVRREWGHAATAVEPGLVQSIRAATAGHTDAWSPEELLLLK